MAAVERRLNLLTSGLTPRERALLTLRAWCAGEEVDERLHRHCPPQDRAEVRRLVGAVERASQEAHGVLVLLLEWTAKTEAELHAFRLHLLLRDRIVALERVARKPVAPLPPPWDMGRKVPIAWGQLVDDEAAGIPVDWDDHFERVLAGLRRSIAFRWRDVLALEDVFSRLAAVVGERVIHVDVEKRLRELREATLRLAADLESSGYDVSLPSDRGSHGAVLEEAIDWETIADMADRAPARELLSPERREEIGAWERRQAAALRSGT